MSKEKKLLVKPIDLTPKKILTEAEYEKLLEYKYRYLELKEILEKIKIINVKGDNHE